MDFKKLTASVEAMIFASGEPVQIEKIAQVLQIETETAVKICERIASRLDETESGICLKKLGESYQFCTRPDYAEPVRALLEIRRNTPLSQAALEVLAIIAYNQPVTKSFAEQIRGVDSSGVLNSLVAKGLIEEVGRLELPGRPILYGTTAQFLRCFSLTGLNDLPPVPKGDKEDDQESELSLHTIIDTQDISQAEEAKL